MAEDPKSEDTKEHHAHHEHEEHAVHEKSHAAHEHESHEHHEHHEHAHKPHAKKFDFASTNLLIALSLIFIVVLVANVYMSGILNISGTAPPTQTQPPANLQLVTITTTSCTNCFDLSTLASGLKQLDGANLTSEKTIDMSSSEAQSLITKYSITKIPIAIITGQINDSRLTTVWQQIGVIKGDAVVTTAVPPPYYDITTSKVVGLVTFTAITDSTCANCSKVDDMIKAIESTGVIFGSNKTVDYSTQEAKTLVSKYNLTKLPAIIFSNDISIYTTINSSWKNIGKIAPDGLYVLTEVNPPFKNLSTGKVQGIVDVTYLVDNSCTACYNTSIHHDILVDSFKVYLGTENTYDVNSTQGKALISKYKITVVPTFIISSDAKFYAGLMQVWPTVGTNETDGWYVFRDMSALSGVTYMNLTSGMQVSLNSTQ